MGLMRLTGPPKAVRRDFAGRLARAIAASFALGGWPPTPLSRPVRPEVPAFRDWLRSEYAACFGVRAGFVRRTPAGAGRQGA